MRLSNGFIKSLSASTGCPKESGERTTPLFPFGSYVDARKDSTAALGVDRVVDFGSGGRLLAKSISIGALCAAAAFSQVNVTVDDTSAAPGPNTVVKKIGVCNATTLPIKVQGYKFRTQQFAGYTTWMQTLSHGGTSPVDYTQTIPTSEEDMQAGQCRANPTDYTGNVPAGQDGKMFDLQSMVKTGSCAEVPPYTDAAGFSCTDLDPIRSAAQYESNACLIDTIGANGGDAYGGFVSTFVNQTQIQAVIPNNKFVISGTDVRWNPYAYGPQYMMALGAVQELFNVDMQFMAGVASKETFLGLVNDATNAPLGVVPFQAGVYGFWQVESGTFDTWVKAYPQFFPKYGPCISNHPDVTTAFPACAASMDDPPTFYLRPTPTTQMGPNSPQLINGAISSALGFYDIYDALSLSTDLCFIDVIKNAKDNRIAFKALLPAYNQGRYTGFADGFETPDIKTVADASSKFPMGNSNYRADILTFIDNVVAASKNCGANRNVYDTTISLNEIQRFLFGGSQTPGTVAAQGDGGLMLHYDLNTADRQAMWDDVLCAFGKLKGKAPSTKVSGKTEFISYRYDFLALLRVVKKHLPIHIMNRRMPVEYDFNHVVETYSKNPKVCGTGKAKDVTYPTLTLQSPRPGDVVEQSITPGMSVVFQATDDAGNVAKSQWTFDKNWLAWNPAHAAADGKTFDFTVSCEVPGFPKAGQSATLWVGTTDGCGNTTVQALPFTVKAGTYCGVAPPLDPPQAAPPGGNFFDSVLVTLDVPGISGEKIYYTTNGDKPTSASTLYTGPVKISGNANVTLRAFATLAGRGDSKDTSWLFTKVTVPPTQTPVADPPGKSFTDLDPAFTVTLKSEAGAVIHYTTDGKPADTTSPVYSGPITIGKSMTINAVAIASGKAVSNPMAPAVFTQTKADKVATPVATPPGNFNTSPYEFSAVPLAVQLKSETPDAVIQYTQDGAAGSGTSLSLNKSTLVKAWATKAGMYPSDTLTIQFNYTPPILATRAIMLDKNGDGAIDSAVVMFDKPLSNLPAKLTFSITDENGKSEDKTVAIADEAYGGVSKTRVGVTFAVPFSVGLTSVKTGVSVGHTFAQGGNPLIDASFPLEDSVAPIIMTAEVKEPGDGGPLKRVLITYSEPVQIAANADAPLIFKRDGAEVPAGSVLLAGSTGSGSSYIFSVDSMSSIYPIIGDSVAINTNGQTVDALNRGPSLKFFRVLTGTPPPPKPVTLQVTFPNGTTDHPAENAKVVINDQDYFIPVDKDGNALPGLKENGKCPGCQARDNTSYAGPIFHIITPGPVIYDFKIFNNVGEFVAQGSGKVEKADLPMLKKSNSGGNYDAPIVWTGKTRSGNQAGTGAYILKAIFTTEKDLTTGAAPGKFTEKKIFGLLRGCCGS